MRVSAPNARHELLLIAESVAREKSIDKEQVIEAMEDAIQKAGRSRYGLQYDVRAHIDRKTGAISLVRHQTVVEVVEDTFTQITLADAQAINPELQLGETIQDPLPPIDFGRAAAQVARQIIMQKVRQAERLKQFEEYSERIGEVVSGTVKRVDFGNVTIDLGRVEAMMPREESIPREPLRPGDRVRAYIFDVRSEVRGAQIFLSRAHPDFMAQLFALEVPEIYDGRITLHAVSRDPGSRAKIAVSAHDPKLDPVGACVGHRGNRVQAVVKELQGEKVDIVLWSEDPATFMVNALTPAEVVKVVMDEERQGIEAVVPDDQLSLAIGRRGQNVRLASQLTGWDITIRTETEDMERQQELVRRQSQAFMAALNIDEVMAHLLVGEGFENIEQLAWVEQSELLGIEGFDAELAEELQKRAHTFLTEEAVRLEGLSVELKIADDLKNSGLLPLRDVVTVGEAGVKTLDDLADLAGDELQEILGADQISLHDANAIIMRARAHWFDNGDEAADA